MTKKPFARAVGAVSLLGVLSLLSPMAYADDTPEPDNSTAESIFDEAQAESQEEHIQRALEIQNEVSAGATANGGSAPGMESCPEIPADTSAETMTCIIPVELETVVKPQEPFFPTDDSGAQADMNAASTESVTAVDPQYPEEPDDPTAPGPEPAPVSCPVDGGGTETPIFTILERHQACLAGAHGFLVREIRTQEIIGYFLATWTLTVSTAPRSATVKAEYQFVVSELTGAAIGSTMILTPNGSKVTSGTLPTTTVITNNGQVARVNMTFSPGSLTSQQVVSEIGVGADALFLGPPGAIPAIPAPFTYNLVRCDRALTPAGGSTGCVVDTSAPTIGFEAGRNPDFSRHLLRSINSGAPIALTRTTRDKYAANRNSACPASIPTPESGHSCDEYPFASTAQGAASGGTARTFGGCLRPDLPAWRSGATPVGGWSACYIDARENSSAGGLLGSGYGSLRIIPGDSFKITIANPVDAVDRQINRQRNWNYSAAVPLPDILATHVITSTTPDTIGLSWWSGNAGTPLFYNPPTYDARRLITANWNALQVNTMVQNVNLGGAVNPSGIIHGHGAGLYYLAGTGLGGTRSPIQIGFSGWGVMTDLTGTYDWAGSGGPGFFAKNASTGTLYYYPISSAGKIQSRVTIGGGWNSIVEMTFAGRWNEDIYPDLLATTADGALWLYPGTSEVRTSPRVQLAASGFSGFTGMVGAGDFDLDGDPDLLAARTSGALLFYPNTGGAIGSPVQVGYNWGPYYLVD